MALLSRVSAALSQLVQPIASSSSDSHSKKENPEFKRATPEKPPSSAADNVIKMPAPARDAKTQKNASGPLGSSFLGFLVSLRQPQHLLARLGRKVYERVTQDQRRRIKKGTIFDRSA